MTGTLNGDGTITPSVRAPRLRIMSGGSELLGAISADVTTQGGYTGDRFRASFALNVPGAHDIAWWSEQTALLIDVQVQIDAGGWISLVQGEADAIDVHPVTGLVDFDGRDLTARFIETKTQESFVNQTASQVVTTLAARHGMTADVTATTTPVSRYWADEHTRETAGQFSRTTNEWDLMCELARDEGFDLYVTGTVLHFHPANPPDATPYSVKMDRSGAFPVSNVIDLRLHRALTLARDIEVQVRSWHSKKGSGFTKIARATGARSASRGQSSSAKGAPTQKYIFIRANLTEDAALKLAHSLLTQLSQNERTLSFHAPADLTLTARSRVKLSGTASTWDQEYFVASITRRIAFDAGFTMDIEARNHDSRVVMSAA